MNEQHILITAKLIEARNTMRRLHGDNWQHQINAIRPVIREVAQEAKTTLLVAALHIAKKASKDGQPMISFLALAVACELSENDQSQATKPAPDGSR